MTLLERVERAAGQLKVFPLPSAVLFPGAAMPLHIFEPRYRALVRDALAGDQVLALGQLEPGWEGQYQGRPALSPLTCAGVILWHEELPDGRYNLLLQGVVRFRIERELAPSATYREVQGDALPDPAFDGPEEEQLRQAILELTGRVPPMVAESLAQVAARNAGGALADAVCAAVVPDLDQRVALLGELDVRRRLRRVMNEVTDLIARLVPLAPSGPLN